MKKRIIAIILIFCLLFCLFIGQGIQANADPFTAVQVGSAAYAAMSSWGISFTAGNATAQGMGNFMGGLVEDYVNQRGGTIASVFGSQLAVDITGRLAMGYQFYNGVQDFVQWLRDNYTLSAEDFSLTDGSFDGVPVGHKVNGEQGTPETLGVYFDTPIEPTSTDPYGGYKIAYYGYGSGTDPLVIANVGLGSTVLSGEYFFEIYNTIVRAKVTSIYKRTGEIARYYVKNVGTASQLTDKLSWNGSNFVEPTVIDPSQQWLGQVGDYQDTNLEQLLGNILEDVEGNNLIVVGEVVPLDPPQPTPSPIPIDPDTPLSDVPWEGVDTNLQNLYNQGLEEIGAIGDAQDAITDAVAEQTGALQGAIAGNAGVVSGAIDQAVSDIQDAIGDQTAALDQSMSATAEATESIADALEDETINWQKFDLRGLFPFCIPFDIYNMLKALDASPTAPHVELPFVIESIGFSYTIDLDFSDFDTVAAVMRQMELIVYGIALAWATSKVIKW